MRERSAEWALRKQKGRLQRRPFFFPNLYPDRSGCRCSLLRASNEHSFIVRALRAGGPPSLRFLRAHLPRRQIFHLLLRQRIDLHSHAGEFETGDFFVTVTSGEVAEARF
jgi:hypothetical protein